tara:strand:+ start:249 stop:914 length:666 start_codon:yes stop_codon:yes gene_type:complete
VALTKFNFNSFDLTTAASKGLAFNSDADGFETSTSGSMTLIKTLTASSSANLQFVHGSSDVVLDSTYPVYMFKFINIHPATDTVNLAMNLSIDSGSNYNVTKTTTFFYSFHNEADATPQLTYDTSTDIAQSTGDASLTFNIGNDNDQGASGELFLFNPSSTTFVKHFISRVANGGYNSNGILDSYAAGYGNTTSAINAVRFSQSSGNMDAGTIKLYGIKDS